MTQVPSLGMWLLEFPSLVSGEKDKSTSRENLFLVSLQQTQFNAWVRKKKNLLTQESKHYGRQSHWNFLKGIALGSGTWSEALFLSIQSTSILCYNFLLLLFNCLFLFKIQQNIWKTRTPHLILKQASSFLLLLHGRNYAFSMVKTQQNCR